MWAIIKDFPNYKISKSGKIVNIRTGKLISISIHKQGYRVVRLWCKGVSRLMKIYRLKAEAFIPNPENKREVNHLDGDRMNEKLKNLEWATPSENMKHAFKNGLAKGQFGKGSKHQLRKVSLEDIYEIRRLRKEGKKLKEIGAIYNLVDRTVCNICKHKQTIEDENI